MINQEFINAGRETVQQAPQLYLDIDVEADGKAGYGSLLSIGGVSPWGETFYRELRPTNDIWVPSQRDFCEEHGLERDRLLEEGVEPATAVEELSEWQESLKKRYKKAGSVLVAFNASFDYPLIDLEYQRADIKSPFGVAGYCIKSLAAALKIRQYDWGNTSKSKLPEDIIPEGDFTHNALEDAIYQQQIHFGLVGSIMNHQQGEI